MSDRFEDQETLRIDNLPCVQDWYRTGGLDLAGYKAGVLCRNNVNHLPILFGPKHQMRRSIHVWRVEFHSLVFWILTAPRRGTSIEVGTNSRAAAWDSNSWSQEETATIVEFLDSLFRRLHAVEPGWMPENWTPPETAVN